MLVLFETPAGYSLFKVSFLKVPKYSAGSLPLAFDVWNEMRTNSLFYVLATHRH